jgi:hypothetical protein
MANTVKKTTEKADPRFWAIYRSIRKANPEYSVKRLMTKARYAYQKRYATAVAEA